MPNRVLPTVYLIVHELFGIVFRQSKSRITIVTPHVHGHEYRIARFRQRTWTWEGPMRHERTYTIKGVVKRQAAATDIPCHASYSPHPKGEFQPNPKTHPYCQWDLSLPKNIYQLRLVPIPEAQRPLFTGDPHGDAVDAQLDAVALAHAFEYELDPHPSEEFGVYENDKKMKDVDYEIDPDTKTMNFHIWAQLEDERKMDDEKAKIHAKAATDALVNLFDGLRMKGNESLSIDRVHPTQVPTPAGIGYIELMTLAEKFALFNEPPAGNIECTHKTCGHGGTLYIQGS